MAYQLDKKMVIGVSSRTLFDLTMENEIYETQGWKHTASISQSTKRIF